MHACKSSCHFHSHILAHRVVCCSAGAARFPVAPVVGALPPCLHLVPWGTMCEVFCAWFAGAVRVKSVGWGCRWGLMLCCWPVLVGKLSFPVCAFLGFLLRFLFTYACPTRLFVMTHLGSCHFHPTTTANLVVCVLGWYLLRPRWVPCWSALAALVADGVV